MNNAFGCKCEHKVNLRDRTWIHRGGKVENWLQPSSIEELMAVGEMLYCQSESFLTIGHTSNIYFKDTFNVKYLIDTRKLIGFKVLDDATLICECGASISRVSRYCVENGISGFEGMINLPGTVGGGVVNASGCYGCGVDKVLKSIDLLTPNCEIVNLKKDAIGYSFRSSALKRGEIKGIILYAYFDISKHEDKNKLTRIAEECTQNRKLTQDPPACNLGTTVNCAASRSCFRNFLINQLVKLCSTVIVDKEKQYIIRKQITCLMYGYPFLSKYISNKRINCWLWKDNGADKYFPVYLHMMEKMYEICTLEIEVKG